MKHLVHKAYVGEYAAGAVALVTGAIAVASASSPSVGLGAVALIAGGACLLALGICAGLLIRRQLDHPRLAALEARVEELGARPSREELQQMQERAQAAEQALASAEAALCATASEQAELARSCRALAAERDEARITASLDQFSDFQLLGMCDVLDAEDEEGFLVRALGDPAMEQLQALGVVAFDASKDGTNELKWTLAPEWRQAIRAARPAIDERTRALRERRAHQAAPAR